MSLTFEGSLNEAMNKIEGKYSISGQDSDHTKYQFSMSLSEVYNCEIRIDIKSKKDPRTQGALKLSGTYDR
jgi:hypothetical protein